MTRRTRATAAVGSLAVALSMALAPVATASPAASAEPFMASALDPLPNGCATTYAPGVNRCQVYSPSMGRNIDVDVLPADRPGAPVVYVLDGMFTFNNENGWLRPNEHGGNLEAVHDGSVNIVAPVAPSATFFADWNGLLLGKPAKWETFMTQEVPEFIKTTFNADTSRSGIMGMSMGGFASANLATRHPDLYSAVYALSGFYDLGDPFARAAVEIGPKREGIDSTQMWGRFIENREQWLANSPATNAADMTVPMRLFTANGGRALDAPTGDPAAVAAAWLQGSPVEQGTSVMTRQYYNKLLLAGQGDHVNLVTAPLGAHEWDTWTKDVKNGGWSWLTTTLNNLPSGYVTPQPEPEPQPQPQPQPEPAPTPAEKMVEKVTPANPAGSEAADPLEGLARIFDPLRTWLGH